MNPRQKMMLQALLNRKADNGQPTLKLAIGGQGPRNWLKGSVESVVKPLIPEGPTHRDEALMLGGRWERDADTPEAKAIMAKNGAITDWVRRNLTNYIKKQMAGHDDPIRKLAEQGIVHFNPEQAEEQREHAQYMRKVNDAPELGNSPQAKAWEDVSDGLFHINTVGELKESAAKRPDVYADKLEPWMDKVDPNTKLFRPTSGFAAQIAGFDHMVDVLREDVEEGRIRPEQLSKISIEQAVRRVHEYDQERKKAMAATALKATEGMPVYKEYPEQGYKWIELKQPEQLPEGWRKETREGRDWYIDPEGKYHNQYSSPMRKNLVDALKYEGDAMGHCVKGESYVQGVMDGSKRIFSLRDANNEPHVTIEVNPARQYDEDDVIQEFPGGVTDAMRRGDIGGREYIAQKLAERKNVAPVIKQIKGKQNRAPKDSYLPFVQDFVKSGQWSEIKDAENAGLRKAREAFTAQEINNAKDAGISFPEHEYLTGDQIQDINHQLYPQGQRLYYDAKGNIKGSDYATGGGVKMADGGAVEDDYRGEHTAPGPDFGAPMHDVTRDMYPKDFYGPSGFRFYADFGEPHDREAYDKVRRAKDKPDEMVYIHRAIPTNVYNEAMKKESPLKHMIRKGDWVAISKQYAKDHGEAVLQGDYKIASMRVPAKHVWTNGDSIHEWGYHPVEKKADGGLIHMADGGEVMSNKRMIEDVYAKYPAHPFNSNQRVMLEGEGENQTLGTFQLKPSISAKNAVELEWLSAYPQKQGVGSRTLKKLQEHASEHGVGLTLFPWEHGGLSQSKLMKFYKKHGFAPTVKGGKAMIWRPAITKADGGTVQGTTMPTLAQMRLAITKSGNPIEMQSIGVREAPDMNPKAFMAPDKSKPFQPSPGGVPLPSGMPTGGIDMSVAPGQQFTPAPLQQAQQAQGNIPGQEPPPPTGFGQPAPASPQPPSNILSLTPQGQALSALKPQGLAQGGQPKGKQGVSMTAPEGSRLTFQASGPGGVKGINVPRHMWEGTSGIYQKGARKGQAFKTPGMKEVNEARAEVYGAENRDPLTIGQIGKIHKSTLEDHFSKPVDQQIKDEKDALDRLRKAKHIAKDANTLDESEKLDTVRHEYDEEGRTHVGYAAKGVAGHALYTSGVGKNQKHHVINTCPGQTTGCGGGVDEKGMVDTRRGTCFAPVAESQYPGASIRRASHEQAKHDPAMTRDWILAHTGSIRDAANRADKSNQRMLFRPNVVDETDVSSRHVIKHLNKQRAEEGKPGIIANSYGKTNELHDPENGYYVTHSNIGPKVKKGHSISENIGRDKQRVRSTISATTAGGKDITNEDGHETPPKNSYMVTDVKRGSDFDKKMQKTIKYAKYWSTGRHENELSEDEKNEGPEGHYGPTGKPTTPEKAHYGHTTVNGRRYDYQKQHILHPRLVQVGTNKDGSPHMIPTDSRFKDEDFLPKNRFKTKNGKQAGAILMTTPTESTDWAGHQTSFTHNVNDKHLEHAAKNNGEYEIDAPHEQEAAMGKEYVAPKAIKIVKKAHGGSVWHSEEDHEHLAFPEQSFAVQQHNAHRDIENDHEDSEHLRRHRELMKHRGKGGHKRAVVVHKKMDTMRYEMAMKKGK